MKGASSVNGRHNSQYTRHDDPGDRPSGLELDTVSVPMMIPFSKHAGDRKSFEYPISPQNQSNGGNGTGSRTIT